MNTARYAGSDEYDESDEVLLLRMMMMTMRW